MPLVFIIHTQHLRGEISPASGRRYETRNHTVENEAKPDRFVCRSLNVSLASLFTREHAELRVLTFLDSFKGWGRVCAGEGGGG